jgi:AraC family transcriptional regulator
MVDFDMSFFRAYAPELLTGSFLQGQLVPSSFAALPTLSGLMRVLSREVDPTKSRGRLFADAALRLLAFEIAATAWSVRHVAEQGSERNDPRIGRVLDYIEATFTQDLSVFDLAAVAGLSPTQFNRSFRAATGRSPYAFVVDRRLSHAIQLLLTTDLSLAVVAVDSGFADQAHMTRMMRARYGRTPRQVRSAR